MHFDRSPLNQPFKGASNTLKKHLLEEVEASIVEFGNHQESRASMSTLLRLHEVRFLEQAREIGGPTAQAMDTWMQLCADYANGHGKLEPLHRQLDTLRRQLRG